MKHAKFLPLAIITTTKWSFLLLCVTFCLTNSQDTNTMPPTNLLCISECNTCPVICSPPPSPIKLKPPPSPSSVLSQTPPPPPPLFAPLRPSPPQSSSHSPSPPSSSQDKYPPPSYMIYTGAPPPPPPPRTSKCPPTPNNPPNIMNIPSTQVPPLQNYPYYYYFASEATSLSLFHGSIVLGFWVVVHLIY